MKVIKSNKVSLFTRSLNINKQNFLVVSGMLAFNLEDPEFIIDEQTMWQKISKKLDGRVFDEGFAKTKGEFLVCASAYANNLTGIEVEAKVGDKSKKLAVFGDREWSMGVPSKPQPFEQIDIFYNDSDNPPNVEYLNRLTTSKKDKNEAGFMPLDITHPLRYSKMGTYDDNYKENYWPSLPPDIDYTFFNQAPLDQQLDTFLENEKIKLINMHPTKDEINSYIPDINIRCFLQKEQFVELKLRKDTLWLFPDLMIGVVIFRGMIESKNDVFEDIEYIYLQHEIVTKSIEEYYKLFKKQLDFGVDIESDDKAFEKLDKDIKKAQEEIFHIPRIVKDNLAQMTKQAPSIKHTTNEILDSALASVSMYNPALISDVYKTSKKIKQSVYDLSLSKMKLDKLTSDVLEKADLDDDERIQKIIEPLKQEEDKYFEFVNECAKRFLKIYTEPFNDRIIKRTLIGVNPQKREIDDITFPDGIVFPRFEKAKLKSIRILNESKLECFYGDENFPTLFCENEKFALFVTNNDFEGIIVNDEIYDFCNVLICNDLDKLENKEIFETASIVFYHSFKEVENIPNSKMLDLKEYEDILSVHKDKQLRELFFENLPDSQGVKKEKKISTKEIIQQNAKEFAKVKLGIKKEISDKVNDMQKRMDESFEELNEKIETDLAQYAPKEPVTIPEFNEESIRQTFDASISFLSNNNKTPKVAEKIEELKKKKEEALQIYTQMSAQHIQGLKQIEEAKKKLGEIDTTTLPDWAKELLDKVPKFDYTKEEFLDKKEFEQSVFKNIDVEDTLIEGVKFNQVVFKNKILKNVTFKKCTFDGVVFDTILEDVVFDECEIKLSIFQENDFKATFQNSILEMLLLTKMQININISNSTVDNLVISKSSVKGEFEGNFTGLHFIKSELRASFSGEYDTFLFNKSKVDNSWFNIKSKVLVFVQSELLNLNFKNSILYGSRFMKDTLIKNCNFSHTDLSTSTFYQIQMLNSIFIKAKMHKSIMNFVNFKDCDFRKADIKFSRFEYSEFTNILFSGVNFMQSSFKGSRFVECNFMYSNLYSVDFLDTRLLDNIFDNANIKKTFIKREYFENRE